MIELEALEPRMQLAYKRLLVPASLVADLSLARLLVVETDTLLREALDVSIADHYEVYADATYNRRRLAA
jgi:hypothetical protein